MRDRLVAAFVGITVAVVALYGIPRAYVVADLVRAGEQGTAQRSADLLAVVVAERRAGGGAVDEAFLGPLLGEGESVEVAVPGSAAQRAGGPAEHPSEGGVVASTTASDGTRVSLHRSGSVVAERVSAAILPIVVLGLTLTVAAGAFGYLLARRLSRPFGELAHVAGQIGQGRFDVDVPHYRVPEAEAIGEALRRGSAQLDDLVRRERDFTLNASHELRSPITALRLEIEDLAMWPQTPPDVAAELRTYLPELDRLSAAISEYLDTARGLRQPGVETVDLAATVAAALDRWGPRLEAGGHDVRLAGAPRVEVLVPPVELDRILDLLLDDVAAGPAGTVSVTAEDAGAYAVATLASPAGTGGSARDTASRAAAAIGGHVSVQDGGRRVVLTVPREAPTS